MSEMEKDHPFEHLDSDHLNALEDYDSTKSNFYDWLAGEAVTPTTLACENADLREYMDDLSTAFVELAVSCRIGTSDIDVTKKDIIELWRQDDNERIAMFKEIVPDGQFLAATADEVEQTVGSIFAESEDDVDLAQNLRMMYHGSLVGDVMNFVGCLEYRDSGADEYTESEEKEEEKIILDIDLINASRYIRNAAGFVVAAGLGMIIGKKFLK